VTQLRHTYS